MRTSKEICRAVKPTTPEERAAAFCKLLEAYLEYEMMFDDNSHVDHLKQNEPNQMPIRHLSFSFPKSRYYTSREEGYSKNLVESEDLIVLKKMLEESDYLFDDKILKNEAFVVEWEDFSPPTVETKIKRWLSMIEKNKENVRDLERYIQRAHPNVCIETKTIISFPEKNNG